MYKVVSPQETRKTIKRCSRLAGEKCQFTNILNLTIDFRLINSNTFKLESFTGRVPPHAILSHTWADSEILCQEMKSIDGGSSHPATRKPRYLKIRRMCEKARSCGFTHAWVDTCCIDRPSNTELTEATNSIFHSYRHVDVCFVYLSDLSSESNIDDCMPRCRWFTRGWCHQKLLASRDI
jgi:hypothetical protein